MNVCYIINQLQPAGAEILVAKLACEMASRGHSVVLFAVRKSHSIESKEPFNYLYNRENLTVIENEVMSFKNPLNLFKTIQSLRAIFVSHKPDMVHSHCEIPDIVSAIASFGFIHKLLRTSHNEVYFQKNRVIGLVAEYIVSVFGRFDKVVAISDKIMKNHLYFFQKKKVVLIHNGVFSGKNSNVRKVFSPPINVAIIGRFCRQKGQIKFLECLIERYKKNVSKMPYVLHLIGVGPDEEEITRKSIILKNKVVVRGLITNKNRIYEKIDMVIIPSLFEGMSTVMLEAVGVGIPVITLNVSGASDLHASPLTRVVDNIKDILSFIEKEVDIESRGLISQRIKEEYSVEQYILKHETEYLNYDF